MSRVRVPGGGPGIGGGTVPAMTESYDTVTFLSDFGLGDESVGVVHSVIGELAPSARIIDLTHGITPFDVRAGSLALVRALPYLVPGVLLASVDPGGGPHERSIAVEVGEGAGVFLGPDNGLLAPAVALVGGAGRAVEVTNPEIRLESPGATFVARDVLAPAAAQLCLGTDISELGPAVDPSSLVPALVPIPRVEDGAVVAEVLWVDHFGNAQLNVDADSLAHLGDPVVARFGDSARTLPLARTYDELPDGRVGLVVDAHGMLSLSVARQSAAAELGLNVGDEVTLSEAQ